MLFQKKVTLAFVAVCLTALPSPSAALLKRQRVITDLTDSIIDERLFTDWRRDKQKMNRSGIDPDAIERDMEERRWLKSPYSYSEDSNSKHSAADSSKGSVIDSYTKFSIVDSDSKSPETCKFKRKMYEPGQWIDLGTDKCKCDEKGSSKWVECEKYKIDGEGEGELSSHTSDSNVGADEGVVKFDTVVSKNYALTSHTSDSNVAADEGGVMFDCKFKGKMYDPGQWIDLGTDKCKCDEEGSSKWIDCEQYKVGGEGEGAPPSHTSDSNVGADEGGVTVETGVKDADEVEIKTGVVSCPFAGAFTTNNIVVNFDYMVKTNPEKTFTILATYTEIERVIFDSLASEIVDCSEESPKIIVAKSKGAERNLKVMLTDSYPEDQVVGTCDGVENCFIVRGAITVTYTENETEETATLYTMNTIKKKMESGEFNNQGDIISVEYLGKPGTFSDTISPGAREYDKNKSTKLPIILTCSFLFLALASFLAKVLYDSKRNSAENSDTFMEENNDFFMEEPVDDKVPGMDDSVV